MRPKQVGCGELINENTCCAHINCLYFASGLAQNGSKSNGIAGRISKKKFVNAKERRKGTAE